MPLPQVHQRDLHSRGFILLHEPKWPHFGYSWTLYQESTNTNYPNPLLQLACQERGNQLLVTTTLQIFVVAESAK